MAVAQLEDHKLKLALRDTQYANKPRTQSPAQEPLVRANMDDNPTAVHGLLYLFYVQTA